MRIILLRTFKDMNSRAEVHFLSNPFYEQKKRFSPRKGIIEAGALVRGISRFFLLDSVPALASRRVTNSGTLITVAHVRTVQYLTMCRQCHPVRRCPPLTGARAKEGHVSRF